MNGKRRRLLLAAVDPMLEPGEQVEVATIVNLRSVSVRRTAAFAVASALVSGGGMAVVPVPTPMYLAMTGRRIFIFRANPTFARPEEHLMTIPRATSCVPRSRNVCSTRPSSFPPRTTNRA